MLNNTTKNTDVKDFFNFFQIHNLTFRNINVKTFIY